MEPSIFFEDNIAKISHLFPEINKDDIILIYQNNEFNFNKTIKNLEKIYSKIVNKNEFKLYDKDISLLDEIDIKYTNFDLTDHSFTSSKNILNKNNNNDIFKTRYKEKTNINNLKNDLFNIIEGEIDCNHLGFQDEKDDFFDIDYTTLNCTGLVNIESDENLFKELKNYDQEINDEIYAKKLHEKLIIDDNNKNIKLENKAKFKKNDTIFINKY